MNAYLIDVEAEVKKKTEASRSKWSSSVDGSFFRALESKSSFLHISAFSTAIRSKHIFVLHFFLHTSFAFSRWLGMGEPKVNWNKTVRKGLEKNNKKAR